jgi:hypothetical protein
MPTRVASETEMDRINPTERSMQKFGSYLLSNKILSDSELENALQAQILFGGRLGTSIAECALLNLDELRRHLSAHLEIPAPEPEALEQISDEARQSVDADLVQKYRILPLKIDKRKLHLVMLDPRDPVQIDEIGFATGLTVVPYVLPEVQLLALLEHHYGIRRETRYITLESEVARSGHLGRKPNGASGKATRAAPERLDECLVAAPAESEDLMDEELFNSIHERSDGDVSTASAEPAGGQTSDEPTITLEDLAHASGESSAHAGDESIAELESVLASASGRNAVSELALRIARRYAEAAALFIVRGGVVAGFRGDGDPIAEEISGILLAAELDSSLTAPLTTRVALRAPAPADGIDATILSSLGRGEVKEIAVFPILIRNQVVNLLYTDCGSDGFGETSFAALDALATLVSHTYERLILEKKSTLR